MAEAAAATPAPDPPLTLEEQFTAQDARLGQLHALLERNLALLRSLDRRGVSPEAEMALTENTDRLADVQGELRDLRASGKRAMARRSLDLAGEMMAAQAPPAEPERGRRRKGGHRAPRDPSARARMGLVRGFAPAGAAAWAAQHIPQLAGAGAATAATVTLGTALTLSGPAAHSAQHVREGLRAPAVSAPQWTAVPVPAAPSSAPARPDAAKARAVPSAVPSPSLPPSPVPAPVMQPPGVLVADETVVNLGVGGRGSVVLTASGGPVSWSASQVPGLDVEPASGELEAGQSVTVTFSAGDQSHSGFGIVGLGGGVDVTVSWPAVAGLVQGVVSSLLS